MGKGSFTQEHLSQLRDKFQTIGPKADKLLLRYVAQAFRQEKAKEYARHGFARRVQTLRRCIENVFRILPPTAVKIPTKEKLHDAQINIQAAVANTYGCIDNLAWVWVHEKRLNVTPQQVGLRKHNTAIRRSLSQGFRKYLDGLEGWFEYITDYRHALAHRIPLYIPPGNVRPKDVEIYNDLEQRMTQALSELKTDEYKQLSAKQSKLLVFQPIAGHSIGEMKAPYYFHPQLIADFLTIEELADKILIELRHAK
jgi:hypothetical protein